MEVIFDGTHKLLFLDAATLEVVFTDFVTPPFTLGRDFVKDANSNIVGIGSPFIIVEKDYDGPITQDMLTDFQREIAYKLLEEGFANQQTLLMSSSTDYDEYSQKEIALKKRYFMVKQQIPSSEAPFLLNLELIE